MQTKARFENHKQLRMPCLSHTLLTLFICNVHLLRWWPNSHRILSKYCYLAILRNSKKYYYYVQTCKLLYTQPVILNFKFYNLTLKCFKINRKPVTAIFLASTCLKKTCLAISFNLGQFCYLEKEC